jgi:hypothetical protein
MQFYTESLLVDMTNSYVPCASKLANIISIGHNILYEWKTRLWLTGNVSYAEGRVKRSTISSNQDGYEENSRYIFDVFLIYLLVKKYR